MQEPDLLKKLRTSDKAAFNGRISQGAQDGEDFACRIKIKCHVVESNNDNFHYNKTAMDKP
jgi:hypothetical protein